MRELCLAITELVVQQRIEENFERQIALCPILRPHAEQDCVTAPHRRIDQGGAIGDHTFSHQPPGCQDVAGRLAGHHGQLRIPRRALFAPDGDIGGNAKCERAARVHFDVQQRAR